MLKFLQILLWYISDCEDLFRNISLARIGFLPESIIAEMLAHASKSRTA